LVQNTKNIDIYLPSAMLSSLAGILNRKLVRIGTKNIETVKTEMPMSAV
jgi:hypothetical protein